MLPRQCRQPGIGAGARCARRRDGDTYKLQLAGDGVGIVVYSYRLPVLPERLRVIELKQAIMQAVARLHCTATSTRRLSRRPSQPSRVPLSHLVWALCSLSSS
jgi:hypothetical protein